MPEKLAELASAAEGPMAAADGWHSVANPTSLLERLGSECTHLQGLHELTVNGLDAIAALGADRHSRVVWDLDWERFDGSGGRVRKLLVIDTGTGMTAGQLRYYLNQLAASGCEQSLTGNFGVEAKVAAGSRNPHGLEYRLWHGGEGSLVRAPGAHTMIEAQIREWCAQVLVEVVLAARNSQWNAEQLEALLSPSSFTAAPLPRHLLHAPLQTRLGQKLGPARSDHAESIADPSTAQPSGARSRWPGGASQQWRKSGEQAT